MPTISGQISLEQRAAIAKISRETSKTVSEILREAIALYLEHNPQTTTPFDVKNATVTSGVLVI